MQLQEVRDCLLGRLFAYGALARSGRLTKEWISDKNKPYIKEFTSVLISLAAKKRYLQEPAVSIILELVEKVRSKKWNSFIQLKYMHLFLMHGWGGFNFVVNGACPIYIWLLPVILDLDLVNSM